MKKIDWKKISIKNLAGLVCDKLNRQGIEATLVGGACVSIYSQNKYLSRDLDFITHSSAKEIEVVFKELGFKRKSGYHFEHPQCRFFIEFPAPPISIGNEPVKIFEFTKTEFGNIKMLTSTDCVKDRLAAYFYWDDMQSLDQAVMVARANKINIENIKTWAVKEGEKEKFGKFLKEIKK